VDVDGIVYPAGTVLEEFASGWHVAPDILEDVILYRAALVAGMYLRAKYENAHATNDVEFCCNIFRHIEV